MPKLTKCVVDQAAPTGTDYMGWDSLLPGFGLRVSPRGTRTYETQWLSVDAAEELWAASKAGT